MKKIILGTAVALLASSVAYAQDYQFEAGIGYVNGDIEGTDFDGYGLNAQAHLKKVDTTKGPLNEAAFLAKSSFADLTWFTVEADSPGSESADTIGLSGRFVTESNLIIEAGYIDVDGDETIIDLGVGVYINDNMDLVVSYQDYDEMDLSYLSVDSHGLNSLKGDTALAYDLGLSYVDAADDSGYELRAGADYYVNKALSFGAGLELFSVDDFDQSTIDLRADYFVTPVVALGMFYEIVGQDGDGDTLGLSAAMRF